MKQPFYCSYSCIQYIVGFFYRNKESLYDIKTASLTQTLGTSSIMDVHIHGLSYFHCTGYMLPRPEHQLLLPVPNQLLSPQSLTASKGQ